MFRSSQDLTRQRVDIGYNSGAEGDRYLSGNLCWREVSRVASGSLGRLIPGRLGIGRDGHVHNLG